MRSRHYVLMDAAAGAEGGQAAGGSPPSGSGSSNAGSSQPADPAAASAAAPAPGSALDAIAATQLENVVAEKHRVLKEDGSLDHVATLRKSAEAYAALEKRFGAGDVPPASPGEYKIAAPKELEGAFKPEDPGFQEFLGKAHLAGLTQKQIDVVMEGFFAAAPKLVSGAVQLDADACVEELRKVWETPDELTKGFSAAERALASFGGERADVLRARYGNDPDMIWFASQIGQQLREDVAPGGAGTPGGDEIKALEASEAYRNPRHPDNESVSRKIREHYQRVAATNPGMMN